VDESKKTTWWNLPLRMRHAFVAELQTALDRAHLDERSAVLIDELMWLECPLMHDQEIMGELRRKRAVVGERSPHLEFLDLPPQPNRSWSVNLLLVAVALAGFTGFICFLEWVWG